MILQYISHPQFIEFNNKLIGLENIFFTYMAQIFRVQIFIFFLLKTFLFPLILNYFPSNLNSNKYYFRPPSSLITSCSGENMIFLRFTSRVVCHQNLHTFCTDFARPTSRGGGKYAAPPTPFAKTFCRCTIQWTETFFRWIKNVYSILPMVLRNKLFYKFVSLYVSSHIIHFTTI